MISLGRTSPKPVEQIEVKNTGQQSHARAAASAIEGKRIHARAVCRIFDKKSGDLVGWLYEWNTGELVPRWKAQEFKDVFYD